MNRKLLQLLLGILSVALCLSSQAQGWQKKYSPDKVMAINSLYQNPDGSFLTTGWAEGAEYKRIMKIAGDGNVIWKQEYDSILSISFSNITQDGGYVIFGDTYGDNASNEIRKAVMRIDANGNKLWLKTIHTFNFISGSTLIGNMEIDTTDDGGFICVMNPFRQGDTIREILVKRLDANGDVLWQKQLYDTLPSMYANAVLNSKDGGFLIGLSSGFNKSFCKIDGSGNFVWEYTQSLPLGGNLRAMIARPGFILATGTETNSFSSPNYVSKISQNGSLLWQHQYPVFPDSSIILSMFELGADTIAAISNSSDNMPQSGREYSLTLLDTSGGLHYHHAINSNNLGYNLRKIPYSFKTVTRTIEGGYAIGGWILNNSQVIGLGVQPYSAFVMKVDAWGRSYPNTISGNAFADINGNCQRDSGEIFLPGSMLSFTNASDSFLVIAADSGYYSVGVDTGLYNVTAKPISVHWESSLCNASQINLAPGTDTLIATAFNALTPFPYIDITAYTRARLCNSNVYNLQYCNSGTVPFTGSVEVTFDDILQIDSASSPWVSIIGNKVIFADTGLGISACRTIKIYYKVPCDIDLMGRTVCINAHAYDDTVAVVSSLWDQSNLKMSVAYDAAVDSVEFTLKNIGSGNMNTPQNMIVIEDNVILLRELLQLNSGLEFKHKRKADGATYRATIPQTAFNPYSKFTTAAIEGAGDTLLGAFSTGFVTQFPINGFYGFDYNTCVPIVASYDPNQKSVIPKGAAPDNRVEKDASLEYTLEFQNTGTDTAYIVRLIDTLAPYLNPATLRPGIASHPYQFTFLEHNVIEFLFDNINLPDSGANQLASNGFAKFSIQQMPNNTDVTVINNNVSIYFDYNPPVLTNTATVRIGELTFVGIESLYAEKALQINAYPNPFNQEAVINVEGEQFENMQLTIYDVSGRMVQQQYVGNTNHFVINRNGLAAGNFIFEIKAKGKAIGRGRIIAE